MHAEAGPEAPDRVMSVEELGVVVEWKMTRGKWRPRNLQLALSNSEEDVEVRRGRHHA